MHRGTVLTALTLSALLAGSSVTASSAPTTRATVLVPQVNGLPVTRAECRLFVRHLRWRTLGDDRIHSKPHSSCRAVMVPNPEIISQRPAAGRRVRVGTVVVLDNACAAQVRRGGLPCA